MIHERAHELQESPRESSANQAVHVPVPLPLEIPPPPNLSQLPAHILHSGTVETLIGQNEDLMARLKVNIRRNSLLEQQLMEQDRINQEITRAHNSLVAQLQVLQEKGEMWREKSQSVDSQTHAMNEEISLLHVRVEAAEERQDELKAGLAFEQSYRRRIRAWVRPYINDLKHQLKEAVTRANFLDRQLASREAIIGDLRERMTSAVNQMQSIQRNASQDQAMLVEKYEARIKTAETESQQARADLNLYRDKAHRLDDSISSQTIAENRIVSLERRNREVEETLKNEILDIQTQMATFRKEAKELAAEVISSTEAREQMMRERDEAKAEQLKLQDQFESLQAVWADSQKKFEASKLQQESLNKLNQELSRQLRSDRTAASAAPLKDSAGASANKPAAQSLDRIDSLLAALESGFGLEMVEEKKAESPTQPEASH